MGTVRVSPVLSRCLIPLNLPSCLPCQMKLASQGSSERRTPTSTAARETGGIPATRPNTSAGSRWWRVRNLSGPAAWVRCANSKSPAARPSGARTDPDRCRRTRDQGVRKGASHPSGVRALERPVRVDGGAGRREAVNGNVHGCRQRTRRGALPNGCHGDGCQGHDLRTDSRPLLSGGIAKASLPAVANAN